MRYNKESLSKLTTGEIFDISARLSARATLWAIINLLVSSFYWLLHAYLFRYVLVAVNTVLIAYLIVLIVRIKKVDKAFEANIKAFADRQEKAVADLEAEWERIKAEEGGNQ